MTNTLLEASELAIEIDGRQLVSSVNFSVGKGSAVGIVGETGSGKSLTCRAVAGSLSTIGGRISAGNLKLNGKDLTDPKAYAKLYGRIIGLVPQNSLSALNPLMRIGTHLIETIKILGTGGGIGTKDRAIDLLARVGLHKPEHVMKQYPHQLSGGMRQRVMIALAIAGRPELLIADEPTTALDVSVQKDIIELLGQLTREENMALILVSHDLGVVSAATENVAVMYSGMVVEYGPTKELLQNPRHPYTKALLAARPSLEHTGRLIGIPGTPATPDAWPTGCRFAPRCQFVQDSCLQNVPTLQSVGSSHQVACYRADEIEILDNAGEV
ncbi:ABC transporter ATP-binding protein [Glutamicibacter sp. JC586]|uniref:ABC transporter ATP-binding protein n=1 Tax=Glutamicibacter sp. JC586 TaxID=2590552 RepID=UPI00135916D5|nr:ABC transporter ATP-binding protein [Glutamicibacter sp. JC586]